MVLSENSGITTENASPSQGFEHIWTFSSPAQATATSCSSLISFKQILKKYL